MGEPMTDERLEEIRRHVGAKLYKGPDSSAGMVLELLAEVDRLRADNAGPQDHLRQTQEQRDHWHSAYVERCGDTFEHGALLAEVDRLRELTRARVLPRDAMDAGLLAAIRVRSEETGLHNPNWSAEAARDRRELLAEVDLLRSHFVVDAAALKTAQRSNRRLRDLARRLGKRLCELDASVKAADWGPDPGTDAVLDEAREAGLLEADDG